MCAVDTNKALHFYSSDNAKTKNGVLSIVTEQKENTYKAFDEVKKVFYADKKYIQSAMLQSWNKFCFVGGIVEFRARLPGDPKIGGLWPARKFERHAELFAKSVHLWNHFSNVLLLISLDAWELGKGNLCRIIRLYVAVQLFTL